MEEAAAGLLSPRRLQGRGDRGEWQNERKRRVEQLVRAVGPVPACHSFVLGVDEKRDAADLRGGLNASSPGCEQQLPTDALALHGSIHRETS